MAKVTFNNTSQQFYPSVKKAAAAYFATHQIKETGNYKLQLKAVFFLLLAPLIYCFLLLGTYSTAIGVGLTIVLAVALCGIAFNVMHDACHGAFSGRRWVNEALSLTMNALGSNAFLWKVRHNVIHHTYTNVEGVDFDIANWPLLRQAPSQLWRPLHRYQHLYMFLLYGISTIAWMLVADFAMYFSRKIAATPIRNFTFKEHALFWCSKVFYVFFYIALPVYLLGWLAWLTGFLILHFTMGLMLTIVFQLAHLVEQTTFEAADNIPKTISTEWAVHEVLTTANFATDNKAITWLLGGLNFQVEHHLFPKVSHIHYPAISKIIQQQCRYFQLPYHQNKSLLSAIGSHIRFMKRLGQQDSDPQRQCAEPFVVS